MLDELNELVVKLRSTNSSKQKKEILKNTILSEQCSDILKFILDPNKKTNITSKQLKKHADNLITSCKYQTLYSLLKALYQRHITGNEAISQVNGFIYSSQLKHKDLLHCIIDKNLKIGTSVKTFNSVWKRFVPTFDVQLATNYDSKRIKDEHWLISRKYDGVRCLVIIDENGQVEIKSRYGKTYHTLDVLKQEFEKLNLRNGVFDGECCLFDEEGNDDFYGLMEQIKRKNHTIENPQFLIFDNFTLQQFKTSKCTIKLSIRIQTAKILINTRNYVSDKISIIPQHPFKRFEKFKQLSGKQGWEGIVLRKDCEYIGDRTTNYLRYKEFFDAEYTVIDAVSGKMPMLNDKGVMEEQDCIAKLVIIHKDNEVGVGSGLSILQRVQWHNNPKDIIGKTITVKYQGESKNKQGKYSLRFPTLKIVHGEGRNI